MRLGDLVSGLAGLDVAGATDLEIAGLAYDSRRVAPGDLFFALPGLEHDGTQFVPDALARGASAVVTAAPVEAPGRTVIRSADPRLTLAQAACRLHGNPSRALKVVAVTGTNGKTTTTYMLESIFREAGLSAGVIGTTGIRIGGETRPSAFTTPEAPELQATLAEMRDRGVKAIAIEASSHALAQRRTWGLECDACVFTNLTQDHLDYHGTMESYLDAKLMLFDGRNGGADKSAAAVVNADDPSGSRVSDAAGRGGMRVVRFGTAPAGSPAAPLEIAVSSLEPGPAGLALTLRIDAAGGPAGTPPGSRSNARPSGDVSFRLPLLGRYNAANAAAAYGAATALAIDGSTIVRGLETMPGVPGRLERVALGQPFETVVDYAHTPDALERALAACREHGRGRVLVVFGCGGDRDRAKRPLMGAIAAHGADRVWVTNDNPRSENPATIAAEIAASMSRAPDVVLDRRAAIEQALAAAAPGDLVLIAGKGHETTQTIGDRVLPFDDREVARELLRARFGAGR